MAEYPQDKPSSAADVGWRTAVTPTYGSTDPGAGSRQNGWAVDEVPGSQEFNWLQELYGDLLLWLQGNTVRCFDTLKEGVDECSARELFRVIPPTGGDLQTRLALDYTAAGTATGGGNPKELCCDGSQLYYLAGSSYYYIVAADPDDGSEIWEVDALTAEITSLCTDGAKVYFSSNAVNPGLHSRACSDGGSAANAGTTYGHNQLITNGAHVVGIEGSSGAGRVDIWVASTLALVATKSTGSTVLTACAMDSDQLYVGGARDSGVDVWAYFNATGGAAWTAALDTNAGSIRSMCADGRFVYVGTDDFTLAAGGDANLFVLDRWNGNVLWSGLIAGGAVDVYQLCTDGANLYATEPAADNMYQIPLPIVGPTTGAADGVAGVTARAVYVEADQRICTDGFRVYFTDANTATNIRAVYVGGTPRIFLRVNSDDPERRPFHTLAIPCEGRC